MHGTTAISFTITAQSSSYTNNEKKFLETASTVQRNFQRLGLITGPNMYTYKTQEDKYKH